VLDSAVQCSAGWLAGSQHLWNKLAAASDVWPTGSTSSSCQYLTAVAAWPHACKPSSCQARSRSLHSAL